jgi:murein DD-endopeptidase MepM/ murein hydrolase activator NlpD
VRPAQQRQPTTYTRSRSFAGFAIAAMLAVVLYGGAAVATGPVVRSGGSDDTGPLLAASKPALIAMDPKPDTAPSDDLAWPVRGAVTGRFGEQRGGHEHAGVDVPLPTGTPIRAAGGGTVVMREEQDGYGNYTCVAHEKILTCYAHQQRFRTKQGAKVRRGQVIGTVGNTGTSDTPHLHFEVRKGRRPWGTPVNPLKHLPRP